MGEARLTKSETAITQYLMRGYTIPDIAEHYGTEEGHVRRLLKRASEKIADAQKQKWMQSCGIFKEGEEFLI